MLSFGRVSIQIKVTETFHIPKVHVLVSTWIGAATHFPAYPHIGIADICLNMPVANRSTSCTNPKLIGTEEIPRNLLTNNADVCSVF